MANFNINVAGFCVAGLFIVVWVIALAFWRWGSVEARWSADIATAASPTVAEKVGR